MKKFLVILLVTLTTHADRLGVQYNTANNNLVNPTNLNFFDVSISNGVLITNVTRFILGVSNYLSTNITANITTGLGITNIGGTLSNNIIAGGNITITNNGTNGQLIISSSGGSITNIGLPGQTLVFSSTTNYIATNIGAYLPGYYTNAATVVCFEGDSLTTSYATTLTNTWPGRLFHDYLTATNWIYGVNAAVSGATIDDMAARFVSTIYPYRPQAPTNNSVLMFWGGINNIINSGETADVAYTKWSNYVVTANTAGFKVLAITLSGYSALTTQAMEVERREFNNKVRNSRGLWTWLYDVSANLPPPPNNAIYYDSYLHFNGAGDLKISAGVNQVLKSGLYSMYPIGGIDQPVALSWIGTLGSPGMWFGDDKGAGMSRPSFGRWAWSYGGNISSLLGPWGIGLGQTNKLLFTYDFGVAQGLTNENWYGGINLDTNQLAQAGGNITGLAFLGGTTSGAGQQGTARASRYYLGTTNAVGLYIGLNDPSSVVSASAGSLYENVGGGVGSAVYIKDTGIETSTGWSPIMTLSYTNANQQKHWIRAGVTNLGVFGSLTFWPGANISLTTTNGTGNTNVDVVITATSGGGGTVGSMISSGAYVIGDIPKAADTTGTNYVKSSLSQTSTNASLVGTFYADSAVFTNGITLGSGGTNLAIAGNFTAYSGNFTNSLSLNGVSVVTTARTITAGAGLSGGGDLAANRTLTLDQSTFVNNVTMWDAANASRTWTANLSGATDPVWTYSNSSVDLTTGTLKQGGVAVNVNKIRYYPFQRPDYGDGVGAVPQTNTFNVTGLMHYTFSGTAATNVNYVRYEFAVPENIDTAGTAKITRFKFSTAGTSNSQINWHIALGQSATSATRTPTMGNYVLFNVTPSSAAANDIFEATAVTLTGWAAAMTAGNWMVIEIARDGSDSNNDAMTDAIFVLELPLVNQ